MEKQLKNGYKSTEVGVIPKEWQVKTIKEIAPLQRGFDLPNRELVTGIYPVVYSNGIVNYHNKFQAQSPGIVTGRSGTIGKVTYVEENYWPHNTALWVTNFNNNDSKYIYYLFLKIKLERFATGSGVPTLNRNDVHDFQIPIPPLKEQKAIANALSDADVYISSLEELIQKKQNIKQATMQKLLKPKKDWEVKTLGEVADIKKGQMITESQTVLGNIPVIAGGMKPSCYHNKSNRKKNTITISASGANAGYVAFHKNEIFASDCSTIENSNQYNIKFIYFLVLSKQRFIYKLQVGGAQPHIYPEQIKKIEISLPPISEQTQIATILSDMDNELEILEEKLQKAEQLKQGMMQNLLTGKIRLL
ncbi:restriction endonuclease subunit S [Bernardetia sp. OM2101]|uniref:restriction endonuclease subunit S n=1 Tax=Bernardetia sp. OM2101 TaxID=3344876 RepID=UPI0035D0D9A3